MTEVFTITMNHVLALLWFIAWTAMLYNPYPEIDEYVDYYERFAGWMIGFIVGIGCTLVWTM